MSIERDKDFEQLEDIAAMMTENTGIEFENGKYVYYGLDGRTAFAAVYISGAWSAWQAKAQAVPEGRTDFEIISQTIELVDLFAHANRFQRDKSMPFTFESKNPRSIEWWRLACQVQELLTDTDPNNCDFEEYKAMLAASQEPK